jgi:O-antigen ligase
VIPLVGSLPVVKLLMISLFITLIATRGTVFDFRLLGSRPVKLIMALAVICCMSIAYSVWPRQTLDFLASQLLVIVALVVLICSTAVTLERLRRLITVVMLAALPLVFEAIFSEASGRRQAGLTYDSNDLAFLIGALLPLLLTRTPYVSWRLIRWGLYGVMVMYLFAAVLTQSRGGMIGIASMALFLAWNGIGQMSGARKYFVGRDGRWARVALLLSMGAASIFLMPDDARQRLGTIFNLSDDYNVVVADDGSGRLAIWKRGLTTLVEQPWGVGANVYGVADSLAGGRYMTAHNSMLQVFVELGVLGGLVFVGMLVSTWRLSGSTRRLILAGEPSPKRSELLAMITGLRASIVAIIVAGSFLSQAYGLILYTIIALSVASANVVATEHSGIRSDGSKSIRKTTLRRQKAVSVLPRSAAKG